MKQPKTQTLLTPWAESISETPWDIYPRPQMRRDSYLSLNGKWEFSIEDGAPTTILVPFPPESVLSGVGIIPKNNARLHYKKCFTLPDGWDTGRVILHFGAVDQSATIYLNGEEITAHHGGYDAFSRDITAHLQKENVLEVEVRDDLGSHVLPWGKQRYDRGGMWYTPVSGIWQSVWLENVPENYIRYLWVTPHLTHAVLHLDGASDGTIILHEEEGESIFPIVDGRGVITPKSIHLWTPENPYLYQFTVTCGEDKVESYFALRTLSTKVVNGVARLCLNGKPYFFHGVLDQGYFSDGIYTPASPEAYTQDILAMKEMGFNTLRKHIKIEPEHFYYECDRLGMIVFQDMVNNGDYSFVRDTALPAAGIQKISDKHLHKDPETRFAFIEAMGKTVRQLYSHPCICYWTIFNEGWGQFNAQEMFETLQKWDESRFIDTTSGWFRCSESHVESMHIYFTGKLPKTSKLPVCLSEFGGYSYKIAEHSFNLDKTYGYRYFEEQEPFSQAVVDLYRKMVLPAIQRGLCATIYTQLSDVEDETNGLVTYDRRVTKIDPAIMRALADELYAAFDTATQERD